MSNNRCESACPILCDMRASLAEFQERKDYGTHFTEAHLEDTIDTTEQMLANMPPMPGSAETPGAFIRQRMAGELNRLDTLIERGARRLGALAAACVDGPLSMRTTKSGTTYTATVCTSPKVPKDQAAPEPVTLRREQTP